MGALLKRVTSECGREDLVESDHGEKQVSRGVDFKTPCWKPVSCLLHRGTEMVWTFSDPAAPRENPASKTGAQMSWQSIGDCGSLGLEKSGFKALWQRIWSLAFLKSGFQLLFSGS